MKKLFMMLLVFLGMAVFAVAQDDDADDDQKNGGRVYALMVAYLTKELNLSTEEAQKFWPIYNQYRSEIRKTRIDGRTNKKTENQVDENMLNVRKRFETEFEKAISKEKVNKLFRAEKQFAATIRRELMERRQNQANPRRLKQIP
jgi:hypothetical protein